jgi:hypothetical protein
MRASPEWAIHMAPNTEWELSVAYRRSINY